VFQELRNSALSIDLDEESKLCPVSSPRRHRAAQPRPKIPSGPMAVPFLVSSGQRRLQRPAFRRAQRRPAALPARDFQNPRRPALSRPLPARARVCRISSHLRPAPSLARRISSHPRPAPSPARQVLSPPRSDSVRRCGPSSLPAHPLPMNMTWPGLRPAVAMARPKPRRRPAAAVRNDRLLPQAAARLPRVRPRAPRQRPRVRRRREVLLPVRVPLALALTSMN